MVGVVVGIGALVTRKARMGNAKADSINGPDEGPFHDNDVA